MNWVSSASGKGINIDVNVCCAKTEPRASILKLQKERKKKKPCVRGTPGKKEALALDPL